MAVTIGFGVMRVGRTAAPAGRAAAAEPLLPAPGPQPGRPLVAIGGAPGDALGRVVLGMLESMAPGPIDPLQAARAEPLVRRLRRGVKMALSCMVLFVIILLWLLVRGAYTYVATDDPECSGPMRIWLFVFMILQLSYPFFMPTMTLVQLLWCLGGLVFMGSQPHCSRPIHEFQIEASVLQSCQAALLISTIIVTSLLQPIMQQLGELLSRRGTDPEVIARIAVLPPTEVPAGEECTICLSADEEGLPWRQLQCGHRFHEPCLLEWLGKARQCPVCRLDLQRAYCLSEAAPAAERGEPFARPGDGAGQFAEAADA